MSENELPSGWARVPLADVATWGSGGTPSRKNPKYFTGTIPWLKTGELGGKFVRSTEEQISEEGLENSAAKLYPKGAVCVAMYGATIGKASILAIEATTNQACAVGLPHTDILDSEFLYYFLTAERRNFINAGIGGAQPNISQGLIRSWPFPLPPLPEQKRIVAKIEELFSELEAGEESLRLARRQLGVYRQSLLKQAFEGHLTAKWRDQNTDKQKWHEVALSAVVEFTNGFAFKSDEYAEAGVPVVRISDISEAGVSLDNAVKIPARPEFEKFRLQNGDILIAMSGATTGKFGQLKTDQKCYQNQRVGCFRSKDERTFSQRFLHHLLHGLKRKIEKDAYGGAQPNISGKQINAYTVPCPSPEEQQQIVRLLDEQFEVIERNEREIDGALRKSEALRQAILKRAFTGRLVPQDPADEPASQLLARLRAELDTSAIQPKALAAVRAKPTNPHEHLTEAPDSEVSRRSYTASD